MILVMILLWQKVIRMIVEIDLHRVLAVVKVALKTEL